VRDKAAEAVAAALIALGLTAVAASFLQAISARGALNFEQELLRTLRTVVAKGLAEGWTADATALAIQEAFTNVSSTTAQMLAQTELTTLVNERAMEAANKVAVTTAEPLYKKWRTVGDNRVRVAHAHAEGQTVPVSQPFSVGGFSMMFPGDPSAPMRLVARCRCRLEFSHSLTASADPWYQRPDPWYEQELVASASLLEQALARNPSRVIIEYDTETGESEGVGWPELDREVSYQIKYFYGHGYWSGKQQSGGPPITNMDRVMQLAVLIATNPELPLAKETRDRLEHKGLLY